MRLTSLAVLAAGAVLAACSKPEPAAGAPSPNAVTIDSTAPAADSMKAADSTKATIDSAKPAPNAVKDSTAPAVPDSAAKP